MTEALEKELEDDVQETDEIVEDENQDDENENQDSEEQEENTETVDTQQDDDEERKRIAREKYAERQRQKQESEARQRELQQKKDDGTATKAELDENDQLKAQLKEVQGYLHQQKRAQLIKQAEKELAQIETSAKNDPDFKAAYPDYEEKVNNAIEFAKIRLMSNGMSEDEASESLRFEKTLLADRAVSEGKDPLQAIYEEAESINSSFELFAEKMGYTKGKAKTNLQAQREASKPNPMGSGAGKGSNAVTRKFDELGDDDLEEIKNTSIWDIE